MTLKMTYNINRRVKSSALYVKKNISTSILLVFALASFFSRQLMLLLQRYY